VTDMAQCDATILDDEWLIDLGEVNAWEPAWDIQPSHPYRALVAVVLGTVCLLGLGTAAPLGPRPSDPLWTATWGIDARLAGVGDDVYLVERAPARAVTALDGRTGERHWRLDVPHVPFRVADIGGGIDAILIRPPNGSYRRNETDSTILVDRSTGRVLVHHTGLPMRRSGGLVLFEERGRPCEHGGEDCVDVAAVDTGTAAEIWRLRLPPNGRLLPDSVTTRGGFTTAAPDGSITLRDVATSAAVVSTPPRTVNDGTGVRLSAVSGGVLVVGRADGEFTELVGYDTATLTKLWSQQIARDPGRNVADPQLVGLGAFGELVRVSDGGGSTIVDPATGHTRFRTDLTVVTQLGAGVLVALSYLSHRGGLGNFATDIAALNPRTGAIVTIVPGARMIDDPAGTDGRAVLQVSGKRRTGFAIMDAGGGLRQLFSVEYTDLSCVAGRSTVTCLDELGALRTWLLPG
jgi:outer membrane protein assembly factor BamB